MQVKVGGLVYHVEFVDNWRECGTNDDDAIGHVFSRDLTIKVDNNYTGWKRETLLHEIIHTISDDRGINFTEEQVEQFSKGLYQVIVDNPQTMLYIMGLGMIGDAGSTNASEVIPSDGKTDKMH
jgi:hypothetical protein